MGAEIRKAAYSIHNMFSSEWIEDKSIPMRFISECKGIAFLTVVKGGFVVAPRIGTGLVIARMPHDGSWTAPTAIGTVGCAWGALVGADMTDMVIILNTDEAVTSFSGKGQVCIGAGLEVAIGPVGRSGSGVACVTDKVFAPAYSYSHSRGLYAGLCLEGSVVVSRPDVNFKFYGRSIEPLDILQGTITPPRAAQPLYDALAHALSGGGQAGREMMAVGGGGGGSGSGGGGGGGGSASSVYGRGPTLGPHFSPSPHATENGSGGMVE